MASRGSRRTFVVSLLAVALFCVPLLAASKKSASEAPKDASSQTTASPDQPSPSPLEGTDLGRMLKRDTSNLLMRRARDGAMMVDLAGGFRSVLVVQISEEGKPVISCIVSEKQAEAIFVPRKNAPKEK